jgi:hypothetical protein
MPPKRGVKKELPEESYFSFDTDGGDARLVSIPLVTFENNRFAVNPDAVTWLQGLQAPLAVVVVAGLYRTGKSFLLNRVILGKQSAFTVGPTTLACTKGIWLWSETLTAQGPDNRDVKVVVLDTEGIGAPTADATHDTRIFALGLLLSTFFIYNSVGSIDEQALSNMSLVTNLSKQLRSTNEADLSDYPAFLWVVRDFALQLMNQEGKPIGSTEYLEDALRDVDGAHPTADAKNRIRACLRSFFPVRDCFTMVRPCTNETQLQTLDQLPNKSLRPEFVHQAVELRERIFKEASMRPFRVNGVELNGSMLASMCAQYVQAMNDGCVPVIQDAWSYVCDAQRLQKEEACVTACIAQFTAHVSGAKSVHEFERKLEDTCDGYIAEYGDLCAKLYPSSTASTYIAALDARVKELMATYNAQFHARCSVMVAEAVYGHMTCLETALLRGDVKDMGEFKVAVQAAHATFMRDYGAADTKEGEGGNAVLDAAWYSKLESLLWRAMFDFYGGREQEFASVRAEVERLRVAAEQQRKKAAAWERDMERKHEEHVASLVEAHKFVVSQLEQQVKDVAEGGRMAEQRAARLSDELLTLTESTAAELAAKQREVDSAVIKASGLDAELAMVREEVEDLMEDHADMKVQVRQLNETCLEVSRLKSALASAQKDVSDVRRAMAELETSSKRELATVQASALQSLSTLKEARRVERDALSAAHAKSAALESSVVALNDGLSKCKAELGDAVAQERALGARLQKMVDELGEKLGAAQKDAAAKQAEVDRLVRERESASQQLMDEKRQAEQEWIKKVKALETRLDQAERSEAEQRRQLELAAERWRRKRARMDEDECGGDTKSQELAQKEFELNWYKSDKVRGDQRVSELERRVEELLGELADKRQAEKALSEAQREMFQLKLQLAQK